MINQKLQDFEEEVKPIGNVVTEATLDLYNTVVQRFLPTPAKIHYLFNLRDISKVTLHLTLPLGASTAPRSKPWSSAASHTPQITPTLECCLLGSFWRASPSSLHPTNMPLPQVFQGMLRASKDFHDTKASITRLWIHECFR